MTADSVPFLNWTDYGILILVLISVVISLMRGFVREALSLVTWILAFWVGFTFYPYLSVYLTGYIASASLQTVVAFLILFITTLVVGTLVNFLIAQLVHKTGLSGTDRLLGVLFGFGRGVLVIGILVLFAGMTSFPRDAWWQHSVLLAYFKPVAFWLKGFFPEHLNIEYT